MRFKLQNLRPTGNRISLKNLPLKSQLFEPFKINFFSSGTAALSAAILACKSKREIEKPEVLLPAYSCPDLISAVLHAKAIPVLIDLEPNSTFLSISEINKHINENTLAIIAINFLGIPERTLEIKKICNKNKIFLIEDSAQGLPTSHYSDYWKGDIVIISFGRGKPLNLLGGGATLVHKNSELEESVLSLKPLKPSIKETILYNLKIIIYNILITPVFYNLLTAIPGINLGKTIYKPLKSIDAISETTLSKLQSNFNKYNKANNINELSQEIKSLNSNEIIDLAKFKNEHTKLLRHPVLFTNLRAKKKLLSTVPNYGISEMYKQPLNKIAGLEDILNFNKKYPNAENFSKALLTFPTHNDFKLRHILKIKKQLRKLIIST